MRMAHPTYETQVRPANRAARVAAGASWAALVAAAALGEDRFSHVRAKIVGDGRLGAGEQTPTTGYRLVVQSYPRTSVTRTSVPSVRAKPLGSLQRAITPDELDDGIAVDIVHWGVELGADPVVVAWVEPGVPDLEFDGLRARPPADAWYGFADPAGAGALVVLKRPAA